MPPPTDAAREWVEEAEQRAAKRPRTSWLPEEVCDALAVAVLRQGPHAALSDTLETLEETLEGTPPVDRRVKQLRMLAVERRFEMLASELGFPELTATKALDAARADLAAAGASVPDRPRVVAVFDTNSFLGENDARQSIFLPRVVNGARILFCAGVIPATVSSELYLLARPTAPPNERSSNSNRAPPGAVDVATRATHALRQLGHFFQAQSWATPWLRVEAAVEGAVSREAAEVANAAEAMEQQGIQRDMQNDDCVLAAALRAADALGSGSLAVLITNDQPLLMRTLNACGVIGVSTEQLFTVVRRCISQRMPDGAAAFVVKRAKNADESESDFSDEAGAEEAAVPLPAPVAALAAVPLAVPEAPVAGEPAAIGGSSLTEKRATNETQHARTEAAVPLRPERRRSSIRALQPASSSPSMPPPAESAPASRPIVCAAPHWPDTLRAETTARSTPLPKVQPPSPAPAAAAGRTLAGTSDVPPPKAFAAPMRQSTAPARASPWQPVPQQQLPHRPTPQYAEQRFGVPPPGRWPDAGSLPPTPSATQSPNYGQQLALSMHLAQVQRNQSGGYQQAGRRAGGSMQQTVPYSGPDAHATGAAPQLRPYFHTAQVPQWPQMYRQADASSTDRNRNATSSLEL